MWLHESLRDPDFSHSRLRGIHLHTPAAVKGEGWSILKESNIGPRMAIDEKTIDGVCYKIISNRETSKIALMADTLRTSELRQILSKLAVKTKMKVKSVTRGMAPNYDRQGEDDLPQRISDGGQVSRPPRSPRAAPERAHPPPTSDPCSRAEEEQNGTGEAEHRKSLPMKTP